MDDNDSMFILNQVEDDLRLDFNQLINTTRQQLENTLRYWALSKAIEKDRVPNYPSQKFIDRVFNTKEDVREALED